MNNPYHPRITTWGKSKVLWIESGNLQEGLLILRSGAANGIGISPYNGFNSTNITFLKSVPNLTGLVIPYPKDYDLSPIIELDKLELLVLGKERDPFDFSAYTRLLELSTDWNPSDVLPASQSKLERLSLWGFRPKSRDLRSLPSYRNLSFIKLIRGSIESLNGIERYESLDEAEFAYLSKLRKVAAIGSCKVKVIDFDRCRNIEDFNSLAECKNLKILRYTNCGKLPSLASLENFRKIEDFRFVETNILDGDMRPLFKLKSTGFIMKRHYSHTPKQIAEIIGDINFFNIENSLKNRVVKLS